MNTAHKKKSSTAMSKGESNANAGITKIITMTLWLVETGTVWPVRIRKIVTDPDLTFLTRRSAKMLQIFPK
jgi:hypothetical protein